MRTISTLLIAMVAFGVSLYAEGGLLSVEWTKSTPQQQKIQRAYPDVLKKGIAEVTLPVYLPKSHIFNKKMSIVSDPNYYAITLFFKGATLLISGDRTYQQKVKSGATQMKAMMKRTAMKFIHAEGMMTTDFNRNGVNYSLMMECDFPDKDKRCKESSFLQNIYNDLIIVGGKR